MPYILLLIDRVDLLRELFTEVLVPEAVWSELDHYHPHLMEITFLRVRNVDRVTELSRFLDVLDKGESEAILLAEETDADLLLIDESLGRRIAKKRGVTVMGLLGIFLPAKQRGLIPEIKPLVDGVEKQAGFYLGLELNKRILKDAGESSTWQ